MIAIISTNMDQSTSDVIDWLLFYQKDFIRINIILPKIRTAS